MVGTASLAVSQAGARDFLAPFDDPLGAVPTVVAGEGVLSEGRGRASCSIDRDFSKPVALAEAVDLALCNNPQIMASWVEIKTQSSLLGEARAAYLPTLSATLNHLRTRTDYSDSNMESTVTRGQAVYATLSWRIFDFGGREANRVSANSMLLAAIANRDATIQKISAAVVQSYFDAQTSAAILQARQQNEAAAASALESATRSERRGAASRSDILQATTALAKASLERGRAFGDHQKALAVLAYWLGVPQQTRIILVEELGYPDSAEIKSLDSWLDIALREHPAIVSARAQWESSKQKITVTRSAGLPVLDFTANYYQNGYPAQGLSATQSKVNTVGFSFTIPLFDGFSSTYKIRGAEARAEQREADLRDVQNNVLMEVVKVHAETVASSHNLRASENLLTAAQESREASLRRYDKGAADILEILSTQTALSDAQQERIRCLSEWRSARLRLLASVGLLGRAALVP